ncbi:MAG: nucleotidyl transferase AbiEii/AbiGii toxin family protein [Acidobacteriota bacterium]
MNPIFAAAIDVEHFCESQGWRFCFIGALAVIRWGEPRLTQDVDLTVLTGFGGEEHYIDALLHRFRGRREDARTFAVQYRVLLLEAGTIPVDVALGAMPFEEHAVERASAWPLSGQQTIRTCSAEDLVVFKAFAGRDKDWLDIAGIVVRQGKRLDGELILAQLAPLLDLKGTTEDLQRVERLLARA